MAIKFEYPNGATPLDPDEAEGLLPEHIETKSELNEWEQQNILEGERWAFEQKRGELLTVDFMFQLHKALFGNTWRWAGKIRRTDRSAIPPPPGRNSSLFEREWPILANDGRFAAKHSVLNNAA